MFCKVDGRLGWTSGMLVECTPGAQLLVQEPSSLLIQALEQGLVVEAA